MSDETTPTSPDDDPLARLRARASRPRAARVAAPVESAAVEPQQAESDPVVPDPVEPDAIEPAESARRPRFGARPALVGIVVVLLALAVGAGVRYFQQNSTSHNLAATSTNRAAILTAAVAEVTETSSYSYKSLPQDEARAAAGLTPAFAASYRQKFAQLEAEAKQYHVVATASIDSQYGAAIVRQADADHATVLLYVDQVSTNTQHKGQRLDRTRVIAQLTKVGGHWLVAGLTTI